MPSLRSFRWMFALVCLTVFGTVASAQTGGINTTTFTGTVYSPNGAAPGTNGLTGDPIPNILVYIVEPGFPPPTFTQGVNQPTGSQTGCGAQPDLVPTQVLGSATSAFDGTFTISVTGPLPTPSVTLVIQAGKWRRQYTYATSSLKATNNFPNLAMPAASGTQADGSIADLPYIAVVTGSADDIECIFRQIGISDSMVSGPNGGGHIQLYPADANAGSKYPGGTGTETTLLGNGGAGLYGYDLVMFGCQGSASDADVNADANNLTNYVNDSGRIFATHYEYIWLSDNTTFNPVANGWTGGGSPSGTAATVNTTNPTTFPEGVILGNWLNYIGALAPGTTPPPYIVDLSDIRNNTSSINPPAVSWATLNSDGVSMQFTFDTPIGAAGTPTVSLAYTNPTAPFLTGDTGDVIGINVMNTSSTNVDNSLVLTISLPNGVGLAGWSDAAGSAGWTSCNGVQTVTCTRTSGLSAGATDSLTIKVAIASTATLGNAVIASSLSGGSLTSNGQCGRVLYNDYHVEEPPVNGGTSGGAYPKECGTNTTLTNVQKFLEFSLYNLSSFIATASSDTIDIQGLPVVTWTNPLPTIPFGTTPYYTVDPAVATYQGTNVAGTLTYSPTSTTILPVGVNEPVCVTGFVPSITLDYVSVTTSTCSVITVTADTTTTTMAAVPSPIFYGQTFTLSTPTVTTAGPATLNEGTVTITISGGAIMGSVPVCTISLGGTCAPLTTLYDAGTYSFQACYTDTIGSFANSCSAPYTVIINPDPTATVVASSNDPAAPGSSVTLTATVADQYATALGSVQFLDNGTPLGGPVALSGTTATYTTSAFIIGQHNITACYAPSIDPSGTYDFLTSCSPNFIQQVVLVPSPPLGTVTLLNSSANPSIVGQPVTFTAVVATTGTFVSTPTGTINFFDGTTALNPTPTALNASGAATFTTSTLTAGTHPITAVYSGNTTYATSTSQVLSQVVTTALTPAGTGFLMQVNPTAISVGVGSTATVAVSIAALNNFSQAVQLTCTGAPYETTCTFAQSLIPSGGGKTTLSITPASPSACGSGAGDFTATGGFGGSLPLVALSAGIALVFFRKRKRVVQGLTLVLALCLLPVLNGCSTRCTDLGTQPNTYVLTVTGTAVPGGSNVTQTSTQTIVMNVHL